MHLHLDDVQARASDPSAFCIHLHLALTCIFLNPHNVFRYWLHMHARCKFCLVCHSNLSKRLTFYSASMYGALWDIEEMLETVRCAESSSLWSSFFPFTGHDAIGSVTSLTKKANLRVWIQTHTETKQFSLGKETLWDILSLSRLSRQKFLSMKLSPACGPFCFNQTV